VKISVIIPTKDRPVSLKESLESLIENAGTKIYEIIIIDGSTPENHNIVKRIVKEIRDKYNVKMKLFLEPRRGVCLAINQGIINAEGEIIVRVDDDVVFGNNWLLEIINILSSNHEIGCCFARVIPKNRDYWSYIYNSVLGMDKGSENYIIKPEDMSIRALIQQLPYVIRNLGQVKLGRYTPPPFVGYILQAFRHETIQRVGLYDETIGLGTPVGGGEEPDIAYRVLRAGLKVAYVGRSVLYHECSRPLSIIMQDAFQSGKAKHAVLKKYMKKDPYMFVLYILTFLYLMFAYIFTDSKKLSRIKKLLIKLDLLGFIKGK